MPIKPRVNSLNNLEESFKKGLLENVGITQWNSDSISRNLYEGLAFELSRLNRETTNAFNAIQFQYAAGKDLERIAENYGLKRSAAKRAFSNASEYNVFFYCNTSFGSINGGNSILVPKGTEITVGTSERSVPVIYETISDITLDANSNKKFISVKAKTVGGSQNVGAGTIRFHNFRRYSDAVNSSLKILNTFPILNGENLETDESLRYKIYTNYSTLLKESRSSIIVEASEVAGVEEVKIAAGYYGVGTLGVFVFGPEGLVNDSILTEVKNQIIDRNPPGTQVIVRNGISNYLDINMTLWVSKSLDSQALREYERIAREEFMLFVKENSKSKSINLEMLKERILMRTDKKVGLQSRQKENKIYDAVYIRKDYGEKLISSSEREVFVSMVLTLSPEEYLRMGELTVNFDFIEE